MSNDFRQRYITARKNFIKNDFNALNPMQLEAVMCTEGPLLLLAGAGSGKTTVLINRVVNLMRYGHASDSNELPANASEDDIDVFESGDLKKGRVLAALEPVEPWRIIAITFTNKAANELKTRLERAVGEQANEIWAQTFHSACVRILRRDAERLGFSRSFTIYDTADSQSLMKRIIKDFDLDEKLFPYRYVLSVISKAKDEMLTPEQFLFQAKKTYDTRRIKTGELYMEYAKRMREADAMDFDDLLLNAVLLLQEHDDVREYYQRKFKYVLVDEYQDTNNLQYLLASTLAGGYENICVVGDDDQSIYKFRGATIKNILDFEKQYKHSRVIKLEQNYRSTGHILKAANAVISNNTNRKGKELWTAADDGNKPVLYMAQNENEEAQYVADCIFDEFQKGGSWSDNAVLYRMNAQSNRLEYAFKRRGIPYKVFGGTKFFDRAEVKDMLSYLCLIQNPADDLRLLRIINVPARGIGATSVDNAAKIAAQQGRPLYEIVKDSDKYPELQRASAKMRQFAYMIEELRSCAGTMPLDAVYDELIERCGYIRMLQEKDTPENAARIENVKELKSNILSYIKDTGDTSLSGFLDEVALYTDLDKMDEDSDCVVMMTIHASKGLEFPSVFMVGVEEGIFPGIRAIGDHDEMEEERRLCYVAITRAKRRLFITCARQRMLFGHTSTNRVSRFVEEIPEAHIEKGYIQYGYNYSDTPKHLEKKPKPAVSKPIQPIITAASSKAAPPDFSKGDMIEHKSFGRGMIVTMTPMGGDFLVEIAFDGIGTKRLMLKAASRLMKKA